MKMRRVTLIVALSLCLTMFGCQSENNTAGQSVYKLALDETPTDLDPAHASSLYINHIVVNAYDTLYSYKYLQRPYQLKPRLAEALPVVSADGLTYTIRIKRGVHFIDDPAFPEGKGREVVADDVIYSLKRHFDPKTVSRGAWLWSGRVAGLDDWGKAGADYAQPVAGLTALDSHTLQIKLVKPYPQLVHTFAQGFSSVVPHEAVKAYGREFSIRPVGSGPYKVTRFDSARAVLTRNPNYRQEPIDLAFEGFDPARHAGLGLEQIAGKSPPLMDRIEINFIPEDTARVTSLTKGDELHAARLPSSMYDQMLVSKVPAVLKPDLAERYHMQAGMEPAFVFHSFNLDDEDFGYSNDPEQNERNKQLRCAVIKGFDWNERNDRYYSGVGTIFPGVIPPSVPEFDQGLEMSSVTSDLEAARTMLSSAGWTAENLPVLTFGYPASTKQTQMYEQFRGFMAQIGYPSEKIVAKQYASFGNLVEDWKKSRLPLINKAWLLDYPDAENTLQLFYGPNHAPGANDSNYNNPRYDKMYEESSVMQPGAERTRIYRQMNKMVIDDCVAMTGLSRMQIILWDKRYVAYPDRAFVAGFYFPYVDMATQSAAQ